MIRKNEWWMKETGQKEIWGKMQQKLLTTLFYCQRCTRGFDAEDPPEVVVVSEGKPGS